MKDTKIEISQKKTTVNLTPLASTPATQVLGYDAQAKALGLVPLSASQVAFQFELSSPTGTPQADIHTHVATLSITQVQQLVEVTVVSVTVTSDTKTDTVAKHSHTLTIGYDKALHQFTVLDVSVAGAVIHEVSQVGTTKIDESNLVHKTGDESISGNKTFTTLQIVNPSFSNSISIGTLLAPNGISDMYFSVGNSLSNGNAALIGFTKYGTSAFLTTYGRPANDLLVNTAGNVGMGTSFPSQKLEVNGNIKAIKFIGDGSQLSNLPNGNYLPTTEYNPDEYTVDNVTIFQNKISVPYASDDDDAVNVKYATNAFLRADVQSNGTYIVSNDIFSNNKITATNFIGDGSKLTNLPASTSIANTIARFTEYTATADGVQQINVASAIDAFDVQSLEVNGYVRAIYKGHYSVANNTLTISTEANIKAGDKIIGSYYK